MKHLFPVVAASLAILAAPAIAAADRAPADPGVAQWVQLELDLIAAQRVNPPRASRALALVSRAMYDAAAAARTADEAAVAGAASTVLAHLFPESVPALPSRAAAAFGGSRASISSFVLGQRMGRRMIARAETDGSAAAWTGAVPAGPGLWVPTPPAFGATPLEPLAGTWRSWNLRSGAQLRPGPPPSWGSPALLTEVREVYDVSRALSDEEKRIATFWADGAGTVTPPGHWNAIALELLRERRGSTLGTARVFAALNTAQADAFIAAWDAKYAYWSMRPVTAIRSLVDPTWQSYIATPPFPSYVSGHSTTSGAASTVLGAFVPESARRLRALAEQAAVSRLYAGIHFRSDNEVGLELGRAIGRVAVRAYSPSRHRGDDRRGADRTRPLAE